MRSTEYLYSQHTYPCHLPLDLPVSIVPMRNVALLAGYKVPLKMLYSHLAPPITNLLH